MLDSYGSEISCTVRQTGLPIYACSVAANGAIYYILSGDETDSFLEFWMSYCGLYVMVVSSCLKLPKRGTEDPLGKASSFQIADLVALPCWGRAIVDTASEIDGSSPDLCFSIAEFKLSLNSTYYVLRSLYYNC